VIDLRARATEPEQLDLGVPEAEVVRSLADLRFVNRWLGGRRALFPAVDALIEGLSSPRLLDVGCGSADLAAALSTRHPRLRSVGLDVKLLHLRLAPTTLARVVADLRELPFAPGSFDIVTASAFLHHFDSEELPSLLRSLFELSRRGLVVNDLRRARVPLVFGRLVFPWLFRARVSVEDGLVSIRRGFTERELRGLFESADLRAVEIRRVFPYRLVAVARRS
jgi:ubiquinone/menaquinone biosynthesis C-methylase UbiE